MRKIAPLFIILAIAAAVVVDERWPAAAPSRGEREERSVGGTLACPVASVPRSRGTVTIANIGDALARVRVTWFPARAKSMARTLELPAGGVTSVAFGGAALRNRSSAVIEYVGSQIVASHVVVAGAVAGAGTCSPPGASTLVVPGLRTLRARSSLVIFNPGAGRAEVSVALFADGKQLRQVSLTDRVIQPRSAAEFRLSDFAFDTRVLTASVRTSNGRVAVEGVVRSDHGLSILGATEPGATAVATNVLRRGADFGGAAPEVAVTAVGSRGLALSGRVLSIKGQGRIRGLPNELPGSGSARATPGRITPAAAYVFESAADGPPLVAAGRWVAASDGRPDEAGIEASGLATRWGAVLGLPGRPARTGVLIANPGPDPVPVVIEVLSPRRRSISLVLDPGRVLYRTLAEGRGAVGVSVRADGPLAVSLDAFSAGGRKMFAIAVPGTPIADPEPSRIVADPRTALPVRVRDIDG